MKQELRIRVLLLLKATTLDKWEKFNLAFMLYKETPEKSQAVETKINRIGFTDDGLANLLYDLQKLHNIQDTEIHSAESPIEFKEIELRKAHEALAILQAVKRPNKKKITAANELIDQLQSELDELNAPVQEETPEEEDDDKSGIIDGTGTPASEQDLVTDLAKKVLTHTDEATVPEGYKFISAEELMPVREEFPFLDDKDCPDELLVVVGRKVSAYRRYLKLHGSLQEVLEGRLEMSEEEQKQLAADTQEAFAENRALYDELNYYAEHKTILGKHPLFRELVAKREIETMNAAELAKYRNSSATFISKKKKALTDPKNTPEKNAELEQSIADREYKLGLVNAKLGADGKK
jgi:hypothetical protein